MAYSTFLVSEAKNTVWGFQTAGYLLWQSCARLAVGFFLSHRSMRCRRKSPNWRRPWIVCHSSLTLPAHPRGRVSSWKRCSSMWSSSRTSWRWVGSFPPLGLGWRTRPTTQLITCPASRADRSDGHKHLSILQLRSWELWTQLFWGRRRKLSDMRRDVLCREAAHRKPGGSLHPLYSRPFLCSTHFYLWQ